MAKITKATKGGRTIYKIAGTSKYALTLAKAKEIAAKMGGAKRTSNRPARRTASLKTALRTFYLNAPGGGMMYTPAGVAAAKRLLAAFKADPRGVAADAGIPARSVSAAFIKAVKADIEYFVADYAHLRKEDRAYARQKRASGERNEPSILGTKRQPKKRASAGKPASRRKPKTRTPKLIGRAYTNRYGERVGPTRILGRTVDYAMKIVRTKGRGLKATPEHRKEIVSKYRKALQKAGFLRGASTRSNPSRSAKKGASGITLAETRAIGRLIAAEVVGAEFGSALNRKLVASSVTKPGVITGDLAEALHDEGVIENYVIPSSLHGRGYLDFDGPKRVVWVPAPYFSGIVSGEH